MARSRILARLQRAVALTRKSQGIPSGPRALTRRQALILGAAAGLVACSTSRRDAAGAPPGASIAVVGGGAAGLTAAYRLASAGRRVALYEGQPRFGGRMLTKRNFNSDGMFCELGGELVDTGHKALISLADELGIGVQRLVPEGSPALEAFDIGGAVRRGVDMFDPATGSGAFAPIAAVIARDQAALLDANEEWTPRARALDAMSLAAYLEMIRPLAEDWAIKALEIAYLGEYGLPISEQSALNLVDVIGVDLSEHFAVFGESDEAWRIAGGSGSIPDALASALAGRAELNLRHALTGISRAGDGFQLAFSAPDGDRTVDADYVILALPFTKLRQIDLSGLGLSAIKRRAISEMGYGVNSKLMIGFRGRPWRDLQTNLVEGVLYSDRGFQCVWETSRGQAGSRGILTNFLSADAALADERAAYNEFECGLQAVAPGVVETFEPGVRAYMQWPRHPFALGSYASPKVGQYTTLFEFAGISEVGGRLLFAGEHTSPEWLGFMNGAVESGERAAAELLGRT